MCQKKSTFDNFDCPHLYEIREQAFKDHLMLNQTYAIFLFRVMIHSELEYS